MKLWVRKYLQFYAENLCLSKHVSPSYFMFQMLLEFHSPYLPRAEDGRTPLDLATTYEYEDCVKELGKYTLSL